MSLLNKVKQRFDVLKQEVLSLDEYLELIKTDKTVYANAAERMLLAIGEPELVDTSKDPKLSRLHANNTIKRYKTFSEFYGMESTIESIVSFFKHAAQGLEEKKQILYLLGPVGSAKSSLAERLKKLMEQQPIYILAANGKLSPINESPLGLFAKADAEELGIPERVLSERLSPWALKRLKEFDGDISKFQVVKIRPSQSNQLAISKTEPGDENNQDISALVGKTDIRKLATYSQDDTDSYSYSGGLCLANQGLMEFVEMFKAPIKVLHPLLEATQSGNYNGTENSIGSIPFEGIILAHSNESEWQAFRNDKNNEAFIDRVSIVKVPYTLRYTAEIEILKKLINNSALANKPCAPATLEYLAQYDVLTRLEQLPNQDLYSKMLVYDGENIKAEDPKAKSYQEYRDLAKTPEGMSGFSTRSAYKVLAKTFNFDSSEIAANPVHLFAVLENTVLTDSLAPNLLAEYKSILHILKDKYYSFVEHEIQTAYVEAYDDYGQNLFDRYISQADAWLQETDFRDKDTNELWDRSYLHNELEKIEKLADITNYKDFRNEVVLFVARAKANKKEVGWKSYEKLRAVIEKQMFNKIEDMLPVISFGTKDNKDKEQKHKDFVDRMVNRGYTLKQVKIITDWFIKRRKKD
jgi:serine protein kinase